MAGPSIPPGAEVEPPGASASAAPEALLFALEERYEQLSGELAELEVQLRRLRTAANLCPQCGGLGQRWVRGGLYGETQRRPCSCAQSR